MALRPARSEPLRAARVTGARCGATQTRGPGGHLARGLGWHQALPAGAREGARRASVPPNAYPSREATHGRVRAALPAPKSCGPGSCGKQARLARWGGHPAIARRQRLVNRPRQPLPERVRPSPRHDAVAGGGFRRALGLDRGDGRGSPASRSTRETSQTPRTRKRARWSPGTVHLQPPVAGSRQAPRKVRRPSSIPSKEPHCAPEVESAGPLR